MKRERLGAPAVKPDVIDHKEELRPVTEGERRARDLERIQARRDFANYCVSGVVRGVIITAAHRRALSPFEQAVLVQCDNEVIGAVCAFVSSRAWVEIVIERRAELRVTMPPIYV